MPRIEPFEAHPARYEEWFTKHRAAYKSELQAIRSLTPSHGRWIEIGVGTGRFAIPLGIAYGVEPSPTMARIARRRGLEVVRGVAEALPFGQAKFDGVLFVTTICFVDNLTLAMREAHRVLRPGGTLVVGYVDRDSPLGRQYQASRARSLFYRAATFYSTAELVSTLKRVGFHRFTYAQTIFHPLDETGDIEPTAEGYGRGSFVVVRGITPLRGALDGVR
jgi:SAM-dependent methyltransferase